MLTVNNVFDYRINELFKKRNETEVEMILKIVSLLLLKLVKKLVIIFN